MISAVLQQIVGLVFLVAGVGKARSRYQLPAVMMSLGVRSPTLIRLGSLGIPTLEIVAGLALVLGVQVDLALGIVIGMLALFTGVLTVNLVSGKKFDCHCFGDFGGGPTTWWSVVRNVVLTGVAEYILLSTRHQEYSVVLHAGSMIIAIACIIGGRMILFVLSLTRNS